VLDINVEKMIKQHVSDPDVPKKVLSIRARLIVLLYKEIIHPEVEILSLAET
jgi:hypothetical protein